MIPIYRYKKVIKMFVFFLCLFSYPFLNSGMISAATSKNEPPFLFPSYAQKAGELLNPDGITLDSVSVNNINALLTSDNATAVTKDDAIRIAGIASPGSRVVVTYADKSLSAIADYGGNWFVLFSITNMVEGKYPVNAKPGDSTGETTLVTLIVGEGNPLLRPPTENNTAEEESGIDINKYRYVIFTAILLLSITAGWFLGRYYEKHGGFKVLKKLRRK